MNSDSVTDLNVQQRCSLPVLRVRLGAPADTWAVAELCAALWPERSVAEHEARVAAILSGKPATPGVIVVAKLDAHVVGFIEVGLRPQVDGRDAPRPVGLVEGWYVEQRHRRRGVGRALMLGAQDWARAQGASALASDAPPSSKGSRRAHEALGFEPDRSVHFRKPLGPSR
jgi:aminoglycoside 6'-N-acetyltransferase I